jgi:hypothetical protein
MTSYTVNLETLALKRVKPPRQQKTRWVAIHPDGRHYTLHRKDGCWWYSDTAGAGPTIADAIADAAVYDIRIIQEVLAP